MFGRLQDSWTPPMALRPIASLLLLVGSAHGSWHALSSHQGRTASARSGLHALVADTAPPPAVTRAWDPLSLLSAAQFLAEEMGEELPLRTGPGRVALFFASLTSPGSLPNPFASTRWDPCVYTARDADGSVIGVIQTALANIEPAGGQLRTVRFFQNVVVAQSARRKGVATSLLDFADGADSRYGSALCARAPHLDVHAAWLSYEAQSRQAHSPPWLLSCRTHTCSRSRPVQVCRACERGGCSAVRGTRLRDGRR